MASIWKIAGFDIYVSAYEEDGPPKIAELNAINSTASTYHYVFTPDTTMNIGGTVIGSGNAYGINSVQGTIITLITDLIPSGISVLLQSAKLVRQATVCQMVDLTQPTTAPVYTVTCVLRS